MLARTKCRTIDDSSRPLIKIMAMKGFFNDWFEAFHKGVKAEVVGYVCW